MDRGLYIAASGMIADQVRQDQIANDLANVSTTGYKADRSAQRSFGDVLLAERDTGRVIGTASLGTQIAEIRTDFTPAPLKETGEPLDVALDGPGFLSVQTQAGTRYTRNGRLGLGADGTLQTAAGDPVLGADGQPVRVNAQGKDVEIGADGTITAGGQAQGKLAIVSLANASKQGNTLFDGTPGAADAGTTLRQGFLETSGVNTASAMIEMIASMRAYESAQRVIHAIDETLGKGIQSGTNGG